MDADEYERWHEVHLQTFIIASFGITWYVLASLAWIASLTFIPLSIPLCAISCVDTCLGVLKFRSNGVSRVWVKGGICDQ